MSRKPAILDIVDQDIQESELAHIIQYNTQTYTKYVATDRAIPDIRDGLKPVLRRVLTSMGFNRNTSDRKTVKMKRISGEVIGLYHPHADTAVEEAMVRAAAWWKNRMPIIRIKGNDGSIYGDKAAAGRYIEANLTEPGDAYVKNLIKGIVPFIPNYDDSKEMPSILPAQLPYLLINGTMGVGAGLASTIPTHNPIEVVKATIAFIKNPKISTADLMTIMPGPDYPTAGSIINQADLLQAYETGKGKIRVRGAMRYDEVNHSLHIYEVPFSQSGTIDVMTAKIGAMTYPTVKKGGDIEPAKLPFIKEVVDGSGKFGIDIELMLTKDMTPEVAMQEVYAKTPMEDTIPYNFTALNGKKISIYSLRHYFREYVEFQHYITKNEHILALERLVKRLEIVQGRIRLQGVIEEVVASAKVVKNKDELKTVLMTGLIVDEVPKKFHKVIKTFDFTELQAEDIAMLNIYRINKMDVQALYDEEKRLKRDVVYTKGIIENETKRKNLIIKRHQEELGKLEKTGFERLTELTDKPFATVSKLETREKALYVGINRYQYVRISEEPFKGSVETTNLSRLGFVDETGVMWNLHLDKVKPTSDAGTLVTQLINPKSRLVGGMATKIQSEDENLGLFVYSDGHVRLSDMRDYMTAKKTTKVGTAKAGRTLLYYCDVPEGTKAITINGHTLNVADIPLQQKGGHGKRLIPETDEVEVSFEVKATVRKTKPLVSAKKDEMDGLVVFDGSDTLTFHWGVTSGIQGLFEILYSELITSQLVFVHTDGTAKIVDGSQFKVSTRKKQIQADKKGYQSIYIGLVPETLVASYTDGTRKRIKTADISQQGKVGGGIRAFYTKKHELASVMDGTSSDLPISTLAMQPK